VAGPWSCSRLVGTTRETLARTLGDFRRRGLLDTAHHQVLIRDAEAPVAVAGRKETERPA